MDQNENEVGLALHAKLPEKVVKREDLFIVSKLVQYHDKDWWKEPARRRSATWSWTAWTLPHPLAQGLQAGGRLPVGWGRQRESQWERFRGCLDGHGRAGGQRAGDSYWSRQVNHLHVEKILNKPGLKYQLAVNQIECHRYLTQEVDPVLRLQRRCGDCHSLLGSPDAPGPRTLPHRRTWGSKRLQTSPVKPQPGRWSESPCRGPWPWCPSRNAWPHCWGLPGLWTEQGGYERLAQLQQGLEGLCLGERRLPQGLPRSRGARKLRLSALGQATCHLRPHFPCV